MELKKLKKAAHGGAVLAHEADQELRTEGRLLRPLKKNGFTLVELLIVISVLSILASLLSPSLKKAMKTATNLSCSKNLKQLSAAVFIYEEDYSYLPTYGNSEYHGGLTSSTMQLFYEDYLGGVAHNYNGSSTIRNAISYNPIDLYVCPANPKEHYSNKPDERYSSYGLYAGSVNGYGLSSLKAMEMFRRINQRYSYGPQGTLPALWADRCITADGPYGMVQDSNHRTADDMAEGGFVAHLDGSVAWYSWLGTNITTAETYTSNGLIHSSIKIPVSSMFFRASHLGELKTDAHSGGTIHAGSHTFSLSDWR
jgi:prepilin-type N-terminal cleavage/methylation domain-containing protein